MINDLSKRAREDTVQFAKDESRGYRQWHLYTIDESREPWRVVLDRPCSEHEAWLVDNGRWVEREATTPAALGDPGGT